MFLQFLLASTLFQFVFSQQIIPLSTFLGGNVNNKINATPPYSLYVSAHMDTSIVLNKIFVKTDDNQMMSLEQLKHNKASNTSGLLTPMKIQSQAYLSSSLADTQMGALEGFIYITTEKQGNSGFFKVFDVDQSQIIRTSLLICDPCTMVFLNTNGQMTPAQSSTLSTWRQSPTSVVKMYKGIPTDDDEQDATQIFSNPIKGIYNEQIRMGIVEKFSVSLGAFYFKTTDDFYFVIQPYYSDLNTYTTTGYTSTGLYMKSKDQIPKNITVLCVRDTRFNGTTGANVVGSLPNPLGKVIVAENDGVDSNSITVPPQRVINGWTINHIGQNITIDSINAGDGEYFVQYYVKQDQEISSTYAPTNQVPTGKMETTTRGGSVVDCMVGTIVMVMVSWIL